jgi:uncharacterized protein YndB with AHSA1/START domain
LSERSLLEAETNSHTVPSLRLDADQKERQMAERTDQAAKIIHASPARIYRALTDPRELAAWLPPSGMSGRIERFDLREGGGYRMTLTYHAPDQGARGKTSKDSDVVDVRFTKLTRDREIVQVVNFQSDDPAFGGAMTMTWRLTASDDATDVHIVAENVPEGISEADHATGLNASLDNLARFVR